METATTRTFPVLPQPLTGEEFIDIMRDYIQNRRTLPSKAIVTGHLYMVENGMRPSQIEELFLLLDQGASASASWEAAETFMFLRWEVLKLWPILGPGAWEFTAPNGMVYVYLYNIPKDPARGNTQHSRACFQLIHEGSAIHLRAEAYYQDGGELDDHFSVWVPKDRRDEIADLIESRTRTVS